MAKPGRPASQRRRAGGRGVELLIPPLTAPLTVSPSTVTTHLENIYRKLEVSDKPSAVAPALRLGVIH